MHSYHEMVLSGYYYWVKVNTTVHMFYIWNMTGIIALSRRSFSKLVSDSLFRLAVSICVDYNVPSDD